MKPSGRRDFFKQVFFYTSAGVLAELLINSKAFAAEPMLIDITGKKRTDPDNKTCVTTAKALGYVDKSTDPKKTCETCMFFNYKKETPPKSTCTLIPKCLVNAKGSCNSWTVKA